ncbi:MAG: IS1182 family transposase [Nevskiales bacterium]
MALRPYSREGQFWGPSPDVILPADHLARVVDELVESIGVARLNRHYEHTAGEAAFDIRLLCKVWIYAYARGLTSGREVARQCVENYAFRFLSDGQCPDHRTLSLFRRRKRRLLRWVFAQTVRLGRQLGLVRLGLVAIDSVKLQADARPSRKRTAEQLQEQLGKLDAYLAEVEATDHKQDTQYGANADADTLPKKLRKTQRRRAQLAKALDKLQRDQTAQRAADKTSVRKDVIPTDPDAVWVKKQGRIIPGYNAHAAVDEGCGLVVAVKPTACAEEREQLNPMIRQVEKTAGAPAAQALADNGYYTDEAIAQAEDGPTECFVPDGQAARQLNRGQAPPPADPYHCDHFSYDAAADEFTCPQGRKLIVQKKHQRRGLPTTVYGGVDCASCAVREQCTSDRRGVRTIEVHREYAKIRRAHDRLRSDAGQALYKKRKTIVEPVFGQWQHNRGVRRLRLRGLRGCDIELHLLAIGHNVQKFWKKGVNFSRN